MLSFYLPPPPPTAAAEPSQLVCVVFPLSRRPPLIKIRANWKSFMEYNYHFSILAAAYFRPALSARRRVDRPNAEGPSEGATLGARSPSLKGIERSIIDILIEGVASLGPTGAPERPLTTTAAALQRDLRPPPTLADSRQRRRPPPRKAQLLAHLQPAGTPAEHLKFFTSRRRPTKTQQSHAAAAISYASLF